VAKYAKVDGQFEVDGIALVNLTCSTIPLLGKRFGGAIRENLRELPTLDLWKRVFTHIHFNCPPAWLAFLNQALSEMRL
jgi:hypothetical protein